MPQDTQPEFELPPVLRLPQVPPFKVPARRQKQFMARPAPVRYTEEVPVTPPLAPETDLFMPVPVTPPLTHRPQARIRASDLIDREDINTSTLPVEKSGDYAHMMNSVRSLPAPVCRDAIDRVRPTSASALARGERDQSRPYTYLYGWRNRINPMPVKGFIPTGRRSRDVGNGEFLLGCAFLIFMGLVALGLLTWLAAR